MPVAPPRESIVDRMLDVVCRSLFRIGFDPRGVILPTHTIVQQATLGPPMRGLANPIMVLVMPDAIMTKIVFGDARCIMNYVTETIANTNLNNHLSYF